MAKQGMKRPEEHESSRNELYVPEIQGKAKHGKAKVINTNPPPEK